MRVLRFQHESAYFDALRERWEDGTSFINVEHDIVPRDTSLIDLEACPYDWCAAPYAYLDRPRQFGLGLVKFSTALIARHPRMFEDISTWRNDLHPPKHWCTLDSWIYQYLIGSGETRCEAHELVGHVGHPGKKSSAHGCFRVP